MAELERDHAAEVVIDTQYDPTGAPIVTVAGELDASNAATLQAIVAPIVAKHPERVIFSLGGLRYMDSAGISVLLGAAEKANAVHLRDPSPVVRRVIQLTGLAGVLSIES
jgi:anti-sigma B factor antagonist